MAQTCESIQQKTQKSRTLHIVTPLIDSPIMSKHLDADDQVEVLLKMDLLQPSGSFKIRGLGHVCSESVTHHQSNHFVSSSGGNAGMAVAYSARKLGVRATVVVPQTTPEFMRNKIAGEGAKVLIHGRDWSEADEQARAIVAQDPHCTYIHPFDNPLIWPGHATILHEIYQQLQERTGNSSPLPPLAVVCVVGGGGLLCGILEGLDSLGWGTVPVLACETSGADSFRQAFVQKDLVTLPAITSKAITLGARRVCRRVLDESLKEGRKVIPIIFEDVDAMEASLRFCDEQRCLVELACGTGLAAVYKKVPPLMEIVDSYKSSNVGGKGYVVVIICGGNIVSLEAMNQWKSHLSDQKS